MLIHILCMYLILSILIAMGESIQFPKPESEIRFGWGISYNYIGQMYHNLNKYDVVVGLEIPDFRVIPCYQPFSKDPKYCNKWNTDIRTKLLFEIVKRFGQFTLVPFQNLMIVKKELNILWKKKSQLWYLTLN